LSKSKDWEANWGGKGEEQLERRMGRRRTWGQLEDREVNGMWEEDREINGEGR
jgi:hypothetical protein